MRFTAALSALVLFFSLAASAAQTTGEIHCAIYDQAGHSAQASTTLTVEADGKGGVGTASAELSGLTCAATGFSKFGQRSLTGISVTVNGLKIESPLSGGKTDGLLMVGTGNCVCFLK